MALALSMVAVVAAPVLCDSGASAAGPSLVASGPASNTVGTSFNYVLS
jgi:hypothetical protein